MGFCVPFKFIDVDFRSYAQFISTQFPTIAMCQIPEYADKTFSCVLNSNRHMAAIFILNGSILIIEIILALYNLHFLWGMSNNNEYLKGILLNTLNNSPEATKIEQSGNRNKIFLLILISRQVDKFILHKILEKVTWTSDSQLIVSSSCS